jgi:hypothetical protein
MNRVAEDEEALKDLVRKRSIIESRLRVRYSNAKSLERVGNLSYTSSIPLVK